MQHQQVAAADQDGQIIARRASLGVNHHMAVGPQLFPGLPLVYHLKGQLAPAGPTLGRSVRVGVNQQGLGIPLKKRRQMNRGSGFANASFEAGYGDNHAYRVR